MFGGGGGGSVRSGPVRFGLVLILVWALVWICLVWFRFGLFLMLVRPVWFLVGFALLCFASVCLVWFGLVWVDSGFGFGLV